MYYRTFFPYNKKRLRKNENLLSSFLFSISICIIFLSRLKIYYLIFIREFSRQEKRQELFMQRFDRFIGDFISMRRKFLFVDINRE